MFALQGKNAIGKALHNELKRISYDDYITKGAEESPSLPQPFSTFLPSSGADAQSGVSGSSIVRGFITTAPNVSEPFYGMLTDDKASLVFFLSSVLDNNRLFPSESVDILELDGSTVHTIAFDFYGRFGSTLLGYNQAHKCVVIDNEKSTAFVSNISYVGAQVYMGSQKVKRTYFHPGSSHISGIHVQDPIAYTPTTAPPMHVSSGAYRSGPLLVELLERAITGGLLLPGEDEEIISFLIDAKRPIIQLGSASYPKLVIGDSAWKGGAYKNIMTDNRHNVYYLDDLEKDDDVLWPYGFHLHGEVIHYFNILTTPSYAGTAHDDPGVNAPVPMKITKSAVGRASSALQYYYSATGEEELIDSAKHLLSIASVAQTLMYPTGQSYNIRPNYIASFVSGMDGCHCHWAFTRVGIIPKPSSRLSASLICGLYSGLIH